MLPTFIKVNGNVYRLAAPTGVKSVAPDVPAADALNSYIDNTRRFYDRKMLMYARLVLFVAKKTFDPESAVKMFRYLTDEAAREYVREDGQPRLDVATREHAATKLRDEFVSAVRNQEFDFNAMLPAKYKGLPLKI